MSKSCEKISPVQPLLDPKIHCEEYKLLHCVPLVLVKHIQRATTLMYQQQRVQNMFCYLLVWNQFKILIINTVETLLACVASVSNRVIARKLEWKLKKRSFIFFALVPAF